MSGFTGDRVHARYWGLHNTTGSSSKFYDVFLIQTYVITRWGRIGYEGQTKVDTFHTTGLATSKALEVINQKKKGGYSVNKNDFDMTISSHVAAAVINDGVGAAALLRRTTETIRAKENAQPVRAVTILDAYNGLLANLGSLTEIAETMSTDDLLDKWGELGVVWDDVEAAHKQASELVEQLRSQVTKAVMG